MKVFLTGLNGFIGSHLAEFLLSRGAEVRGLVRPTSDLRSVRRLSGRHGRRLTVVVGDVRDPSRFEQHIEGVDYVYHLAAVLMGTSEREFRGTNVDGTRGLLEAVMRSSHGSLRRFLFVSSQAAAGPASTEQPVTESDVPRPVSWYGTSKRDAEDVVRSFADRGLPVTIVRPVAVYGEREVVISQGLFPAVAGGFLPQVGFAQKAISLVYVQDLVRGMVAAAECPDTVDRVYFLSEPRHYRTDQLVGYIADAMGKRVRIPVIIPHAGLSLVALVAEWLHLLTRTPLTITRDKVREIRQRRWIASAEAARRDFGWVAQTSLPEGMKIATRDWSERRRPPAPGAGRAGPRSGAEAPDPRRCSVPMDEASEVSTSAPFRTSPEGTDR